MSTTITALHQLHGHALSAAGALPGALDIPDKGYKAPAQVRDRVGEALAFARWVGAAFLVVGLVMVFVQWGMNRRAQRGDGGEENAVALGWWIGGAIGLSALFSVAGWFL